MSAYRILTSGPILTQTGTIVQVRKYVERYAPLKRGWTGEWEKHPNGKSWRYRRFNSKGNKMPTSYDIYVVRIT